MLRRAGGLALVALSLMLSVVLLSSPTRAAAPIFVTETYPAAGPRGSVAVIGDSVMLGSLYTSKHCSGCGPSLPQMMVAMGWGPVYVKGGVGFQAGLMNQSNPGANLAKWVTDQRAVGVDPGTFVISLGANDILACNGSVSCAERDIEHLLNAIGHGKEIWFAKITMPIDGRYISGIATAGTQAAFNQALDNVAARWPELRVWDWPTEQVLNGIRLASDHIHLPNAREYCKRSTLMALDATYWFGAVAAPTSSVERAARLDLRARLADQLRRLSPC